MNWLHTEGQTVSNIPVCLRLQGNDFENQKFPPGRASRTRAAEKYSFVKF